MRDWTEKHIRELVRNYKGSGDGLSDAAAALLLRLWIYRIGDETITTKSGGTISFTVVEPTNDESLLALGMTLVRVDFVGCNWRTDYFPVPQLTSFSARITPNTISPGSLWEGVLSSLFYDKSEQARFWMNPATYQTGSVYCDEVETDARVNFGYDEAWFDEKRSICSTSEAVGRLNFTRIPDGTQKVSVFYHI